MNVAAQPAPDPASDPGSDPWGDACPIAAVFAVDPLALGGVVLRARPGPVRDAWLRELGRLLGTEIRFHKVPHHITVSGTWNRGETVRYR